MSSHLLSARAPGDGADRPDATHQDRRYVYVARSRRAGGLSLGIDLTPEGHCSFSCIYCQASHPPTSHPELAVDVPRMREDLRLRLQQDNGELKDIVLAGSGEPTMVPNLADALEAIVDVRDELRCPLPIKLFTNGRHLGKDAVHQAVGRFAQRGGQVWIKLDGASEETLATINGRRFAVQEHLRDLWQFAKQHPVGLQTLLCHGPGLPDPSHVVEEVTHAIAEGLSQGARITEIHLLTLSRRPADERAASRLQPVPLASLEEFALQIQKVISIPILVFPSA
ncbi:MAG TPA: hypothetical protein PLJ27_13505 [Polyangiaceae bacterium]|jgi:wyosine [tRNA(Phe)-imidazoG37] synthetase (radical SAM superfamily)|nr:MAG: hypothetical protein BWY17_02914 [Deltaproteobacteria bacterium ADurb.Bin207]HNS99679.1 hypothetical protein [Polyangiaceae bacterium]HNZ24288.1 hypothetical protein [Polyangiaceae bacterium]HOD24252.1 hypothetical protein [Polyangiaceae bacterium]HOH02349.1 hypothetical protein [Polyangiaceae bacterium]